MGQKNNKVHFVLLFALINSNLNKFFFFTLRVTYVPLRSPYSFFFLENIFFFFWF